MIKGSWRSSRFIAALFMILDSIFMTGTNTAAKFIEDFASSVEINFLKCFAALIVCLPLYFFRRYKCSLFVHVATMLDAFLLVVASIFLYYALEDLSLSFATAITMSSSVFSSLCGIIFLKERPKFNVYVGLLIGLIGVIVVLQPWSGGKLSIYAVFALVSALLWSFSDLLIKICAEITDFEGRTFYLIFYNFVFSVLALFLAYNGIFPESNILFSGSLDWKIFTIPLLVAVFFVGLFFYAENLVTFIAYGIAPLSILTPFFFLDIVFGSIFDYFIFGEVVELMDLVGSFIIVCSSTYVTYNQYKEKG